MAWKATDIRGVDVEAQETPALSEQTVSEIRALFDRYPTRQAVLLPALHLAQAQIGYLPPKALLEIAGLLELAPAQVLDVVTFYEMYWRQPKGRKLIQVCRSMSCELCGQVGLLDAIKAKLGIEEGQTTPDGQFTLIAVECLAACDKAPVVLVNETLHEKVAVKDLDEILKPE
ncbi:MAG: hypothetical protein BIFFINMI_01025 [Phycisphaerae bacterium]|nr:hypothetical protein [Phycisphaerae bacterium]